MELRIECKACGWTGTVWDTVGEDSQCPADGCGCFSFYVTRPSGEKREPERLAGRQATLDLSVAVLQCLRESGVDGETIEAVSTMLLAANIEWFERVSPPREKPGQDTNHVLWAGEAGGRFLSVNQVGHRIVISFDDPELTIGPLKLVPLPSPVEEAVREAAGALNCGNRDCFFADKKNVGGMRTGTVCLCLGDIRPAARRALLRALRLSTHVQGPKET